MAGIGGKIYGSEYNGVQTTIATVLGYYGQSPASGQVSSPTTTKISVTQWSNLRTDILKCYNHQNASNGSLPSPSTSTKVTAADFNSYKSMADGCLTNYLAFNSGYSTTTLTSSTDQAANTWGPTGANTWRLTYTVAFPNTASAQYFFNAGGQIRFRAQGATGISDGAPTDNTTKNYAWYSALNQQGTIIFDNSSTYATGPTSPGTGSSYGYSNTQLLGMNTPLYSKTTATYTPNIYRIFLNPGASTLVFYVEFEDLSAPGGYGVDEYVSFQTTGLSYIYYATGSGQVDVTAYKPTISVASAILASPNP